MTFDKLWYRLGDEFANKMHTVDNEVLIDALIEAIQQGQCSLWYTCSKCGKQHGGTTFSIGITEMNVMYLSYYLSSKYTAGGSRLAMEIVYEITMGKCCFSTYCKAARRNVE